MYGQNHVHIQMDRLKSINSQTFVCGVYKKWNILKCWHIDIYITKYNFFFQYLLFAASCKFWIYWVDVNTKFTTDNLQICIYAHTVNSKFKTWHLFGFFPSQSRIFHSYWNVIINERFWPVYRYNWHRAVRAL